MTHFFSSELTLAIEYTQVLLLSDYRISFLRCAVLLKMGSQAGIEDGQPDLLSGENPLKTTCPSPSIMLYVFGEHCKLTCNEQ